MTSHRYEGVQNRAEGGWYLSSAANAWASGLQACAARGEDGDGRLSPEPAGFTSSCPGEPLALCIMRRDDRTWPRWPTADHASAWRQLSFMPLRERRATPRFRFAALSRCAVCRGNDRRGQGGAARHGHSMSRWEMMLRRGPALIWPVFCVSSLALTRLQDIQRPTFPTAGRAPGGRVAVRLDCRLLSSQRRPGLCGGFVEIAAERLDEGG